MTKFCGGGSLAAVRQCPVTHSYPSHILMSLIVYIFIGYRGAPSYYLLQCQLEFLIGFHITVPEIAALLGVSTSTIRRRMRQYGLSIRQQYTQLANTTLDQLILEILSEHPNSGYRMVCSYLSDGGIRISQQRARDSLARIDPLSVVYEYIVDSIMFHTQMPFGIIIDGNMSLCRWGFAVHGAVDGYSRMIVYLHCSTNNNAETVLSHFIGGVEEYGYP